MQRSALWLGSAAAPLRAGPRLARGPREPRAPRASEELGAGAKVSSQLRPRAPPPPPTPARGLGPALPRSPGPPPEAGPGGPRPQFHFGAWSLRLRPADPPRPRVRFPPSVSRRAAELQRRPPAAEPRAGQRRVRPTSPERGTVPGGQTPVRPSPAREQGQDESDSVLRQDRHRGALQGRPAARQRAHPAGAAAVPEDPGPGEGRCRGGEAARRRRGSASALGHAPARRPGPSGALYGTQVTLEAVERCLQSQLLQAANVRDPGSPALSLRALGGMEAPSHPHWRGPYTLGI